MKKFSQLAVPYIVWAALMLVLPMLLIAMYSFTEQGNSIVSFKFTLDHYVKFFTDPDFLIILWRSIWIAIKTTVICLLLGYPIMLSVKRSCVSLILLYSVNLVFCSMRCGAFCYFLCLLFHVKQQTFAYPL